MTAQKICILTETYYPVVGGGETQTRSLAEGLSACGWRVVVITRRSDSSLRSVEQFGKIKVYRLPPVGSEHLKKWGLGVTTLPRLIKLRQQYDLIFVSGYRVLGIPAVLVSQLLGKSCVLKADSQGEFSGDFFAAGLARFGLTLSMLPVKLFLGVRNKLLKSSDAFVALSTQIEAELKNGGIDAEDIQTIPNSVDTKKFRPVSHDKKNILRRKLNLPEQTNIITFTGRLVSYKGLPLLLRVWRKIQQEHENSYLVLLGSGGVDIHNCEAELKTYVQSNGLHESVYFAGEVGNVHEYLQASDLFVFPSENEAFPGALIEAMASGLAVIATSVGAMKEIVLHEENGLMVEPNDFQGLHRALLRLIDRPEMAANLGRAARESVQARYSVETVTEQYVELFCRMARR